MKQLFERETCLKYIEGLASLPLKNDSTLFGVFDAASFEALPKWLACYDGYGELLYNGELANQLADTGPYLIELPRNPKPQLNEMLEAGWTPLSSIFLESKTNVVRLRMHLRRFTTAILPTDGQVLFAFYDPIAIHALLRAASVGQIQVLMSEVESFFFPYRNVDGDWETRRFSNENPSSETALTPFVFTSGQMDVFTEEHCVALVHYLTDLARRKMPKQVSTLSYRQLFIFVWACVRELQTITTPSESTYIRFVSLSILARSPLLSLKQVREFLQSESSDIVDAKIRFLSKHFATKPLGDIPNEWR